MIPKHIFVDIYIFFEYLIERIDKMEEKYLLKTLAIVMGSVEKAL